MTRLPQTTAVPDPASIFAPATSNAPTMSSSTSAGPAPTPLPAETPQEEAQSPPEQGRDETAPGFKRPKLRLHVEDLSHPGASRFLSAVDVPSVFAKSVQTVQRILYQNPSANIPATRSVTLYLEDMDGVAYTKGSDLDNDHKEIRKFCPSRRVAFGHVDYAFSLGKKRILLIG